MRIFFNFIAYYHNKLQHFLFNLYTLKIEMIVLPYKLGDLINFLGAQHILLQFATEVLEIIVLILCINI